MAAGGAGLWAGYEYRRAISGWLWPPPFPLVSVSGDVAYEDGTRLPSDELFIAFHPERERRDSRTFPRPAYARVDPRTGRFSVAGDGRAFGGVVAGGNRITLHVRPPAPLPAHIAGEAYDAVATTPLLVEVDAPAADPHREARRRRRRGVTRRARTPHASVRSTHGIRCATNGCRPGRPRG